MKQTNPALPENISISGMKKKRKYAEYYNVSLSQAHHYYAGLFDNWQNNAGGLCIHYARNKLKGVNVNQDFF